jgi:hypothetical protein
MVFRHPAQNTLSFRIAGEESGNLGDWSTLTPGPGITGDIFANEFLFTISPAPASPAFFRMVAEP